MCVCVCVCVSKKSYGSNVRLSPAWSDGWLMSDTCCLGEKKLSYALRERGDWREGEPMDGGGAWEGGRSEEVVT